MENEKQFKTILRPVKRQILIGIILKEAQSSFALLGILSFILILSASLWVIPFLQVSFLVILCGVVLFFLIRVWLKKPGLKEAANVYNDFVLDDRVNTAYSYLGEHGAIEQLQITDALSHMKKVQHDVLKRKKTIFAPKYITTALLFAAAAAILFYTANEDIELAKQLEKEMKLVDKVEKELEEKAEKEKEAFVKKKLEETKKDISEKKSAEEALKELQKHTKELELQAMKEKDKQLAVKDLENTLNDNDLSNLANLLDQKKMDALEKELHKVNNDWENLSAMQQQAFAEWTQKEQKLSEEELEQLIKELEEMLQSEERLKQLIEAHLALQESGINLQNGMIASGMPPGQLAFSPTGQPQARNGNQQSQGPPQNENGASNSQNGQSGSGSGNSAGSGAGSGTGSGSGSGTGSGSGSGSGTGSGAGNGSGAGFGQGSREFLTVPERLAGDDNMETDLGSLGEGQSGQQFDGTGPVLKGSVRPYSEVFESYQQAYRQSTERYQIPADLEEIVKDYFSNIDPNKE